MCCLWKIKEQNRNAEKGNDIAFKQGVHEDKMNLERIKLDLQRQKIETDKIIQQQEAQDVRILKGASLKNQNKKK